MEQTWRTVAGYYGAYEISSDGLVRRVAGSRGCSADRLIKSRVGNAGYRTVRLCFNGKLKSLSVHRLLLEAFVGPPPSPAHQCNHKDGNKLNNTLTNLEWVTPKENIQHMLSMGLRNEPAGENHALAKVTDKDVMEIRRRYALGHRHGDLAKEFGLAPGHVMDIARGVKWKHLPVFDNRKERGKHFMKLTRSQVAELRQLRKEGWLMRELANKFGVSIPTVVNTVSGKYHSD